MLARSLQLIAVSSALSIVGCVAEPAALGPPNDVTLGRHVHLMPVRDGNSHNAIDAATPAPVAPAGAHLSYNGGKVIQNVRVNQVRYGAGTYIPELTSTSGVTMASSYTQMVTSGVFDWLSEYNTTSPAQAIGRGSFGSSLQITPTPSRNGSTIDDTSIQVEIAAQINSGVLPPPNDNQLYMVSFPSGKTITQGGFSSCVSGGFCAYHGTFKIGSQNVYYGVLPSMTGGCATGCGTGTTFQNQQSVSSHELIEAVTDAEVGFATVVGPPLAWYDPTNGEIGDICNGQHGTYTGTDRNSYTIQKEFSNQQNDCITTRTVPTAPDFSLAVTPPSATVAAGASAAFTVSTTSIRGGSQLVALAVTGLPNGVTAAFSPPSVTPGSTATLTLTASAIANSAGSVIVTGSDGMTTHSASVSLTAGNGGVPTLTSGVPVTGLGGGADQQKLFAITVPAGQPVLRVQLSGDGGTGDADLYVRAGAAPTPTTFDCSSENGGNNERCTFYHPAAATYFVMVRPRFGYSNATLIATFGVDTTPALSNGVPVTGLSGAAGWPTGETFFKLTVPAGVSRVVFETTGVGDADLYVKLGAEPSQNRFDCRPSRADSNESCTFTSPAAGDYFVMVRAFSSYSGLTIVGHFP